MDLGAGGLYSGQALALGVAWSVKPHLHGLRGFLAGRGFGAGFLARASTSLMRSARRAMMSGLFKTSQNSTHLEKKS
eukprot:COSAG02_NODE_8118_length_2701_cov_4.425442_3_plen_77_part_00